MKKETGCTEQARCLVPWGGKLLSLCPVHANQLVIIGNAMGSPVQPKLIPKDSTDICESLEPLTDEEKELIKDFPL